LYNSLISTIADTGSTGHFFKQQDIPESLQNTTSTAESIDITLPNGSNIASEAQATMHLPTIPVTANIIHLFPDLQSHSLLSIGELCDAGCAAEFTQQNVIVKYQHKPILEGHRNEKTRLWQIPVEIQEPEPQHQANQVNAITKTKELVAFMHAARFSPSVTTLQKAVDNHFRHDFPGRTSKSIRMFPPVSAATAKGHLDQARKNQLPTKHPAPDSPLFPDIYPDEDMYPQALAAGRTQHCCAATIPATQTGQIFTDQTGRFHKPASSGVTQIFIL
jgi:hypothetical protein